MELARMSRWNAPERIEAAELAFSNLVVGDTWTRLSEAMLWLDFDIPPESEFYRYQKAICQVLVRMADESMEKVRSELPNDTTISFDGSWDHKRHGSNCVVTVLDQASGKVVACKVASRKVAVTDENFCEVSQLMEAHALKLALRDLMAIPQIVAYVHDNDAKARILIEQLGWGIREFIDPGHAFKSFNKALASFEKENKKLLKEIEGPLRMWAHCCMAFEGTPEQKVAMWQNCVNHFTGNHLKCTHGEVPCHLWSRWRDANAVALLDRFVTATSYLFAKADKRFSTQANESMNRRKSCYLSKDLCWGTSFTARVACMVLDVNWPHWKWEARRRCGIRPVSARSTERLLREAQRKKRREGKKTRATNRIRETMTLMQQQYAYELPEDAGPNDPSD